MLNIHHVAVELFLLCQLYYPLTKTLYQTSKEEPQLLAKVLTSHHVSRSLASSVLEMTLNAASTSSCVWPT